jgi:hypothetical protein
VEVPARRPRLMVSANAVAEVSRFTDASTGGPANGQTARRLRPLPRRADRIARPARVRIRRRKPCVLARRRLFGWYVRLLTMCSGYRQAARKTARGSGGSGSAGPRGQTSSADTRSTAQRYASAPRGVKLGCGQPEGSSPAGLDRGLRSCRYGLWRTACIHRQPLLASARFPRFPTADSPVSRALRLNLDTRIQPTRNCPAPDPGHHAQPVDKRVDSRRSRTPVPQFEPAKPADNPH